MTDTDTNTDFDDYPPTQTHRLGTALEDARDRADSDADDAATWGRYVHGLQWAIDQWDADADIVLQAFTTRLRNRTLDAANRETVGPLGPNRTRTWLVAAGVQSAPWVADDSDLVEQAQVTGQLPPALVDWLDAKQDALNDLSEGN